MKSPVRFMARGLAEEVRDETPRNHPRHCERSEAIQLWGCEIESWIASSRSLSSGARSRDPLAPRNDGKYSHDGGDCGGTDDTVECDGNGGGGVSGRGGSRQAPALRPAIIQ